MITLEKAYADGETIRRANYSEMLYEFVSGVQEYLIQEYDFQCLGVSRLEHCVHVADPLDSVKRLIVDFREFPNRVEVWSGFTGKQKYWIYTIEPEDIMPNPINDASVWADLTEKVVKAITEQLDKIVWYSTQRGDYFAKRTK